MDTPRPENERSRLERALALVTEVRSGEGTTALLMTLNIFLILAAYYLLKPLREGFMSRIEGWQEIESYISAITALLLIPTVKAYGRVASRYARRKLISVVTSFFVSNLVVFYFLLHFDVPYFGILYYVWLGIFNNMVIAQFWAYGNDIYNPDQGRRLFPMIQFGGSLGAILGPAVASRAAHLSAATLMLLAGLILMLCIGMTNWIDLRPRARRSAGDVVKAKRPVGGAGGFQLIWRHRYLLYLALLILVLNWVNSNGEYILRRMVSDAADSSVIAQGLSLQTHQGELAGETFIRYFYADFQFWQNALVLLIQALLVSRILKYLGVARSLFIPGLLAVLGYGCMAFLPILMIVRTAKIAENADDYSLMNTLRAALYLPTTREMKYKAKQAIDTFFVRVGDVAHAVTVAIAGVLALSAQGFAQLTLCLVAVWLGLAWLLSREHGKLLAGQEREAGALEVADSRAAAYARAPQADD
jgi:AAA family ATP:ADP antiporter